MTSDTFTIMNSVRQIMVNQVILLDRVINPGAVPDEVTTAIKDTKSLVLSISDSLENALRALAYGDGW